MKYITFFLIVLGTQIRAQDQIIYLSGDKYYVDQIIEIQNDSLVYSSFKKTKIVPLTEVKGYYITFDTKENLEKGFYKREREYHEIDSSYHYICNSKLKERDPDINSFIQSCMPDSFDILDYTDGFYITYDLDTIHTMISFFKKSDKNNMFFIARIDSNIYKIFTPKLVKGYSFGDQFFISYFPKQSDNQEIYMFILQEISGRINLYSKANLPYHEGKYYLVNKTGSDEYYPLCPNNYCASVKPNVFKGVLVSGASPEDIGYMSVPTKPTLDNSFRDFMPQLVYDCEGLVNRIKNEFYTKQDIIEIIKQYNGGCK